MKRIRFQKGFTVMEFLVSLVIGVIVTGSMIGLLSNSLSNTSRIIQMNKLTEDLRATMQMVSRDIRRASYSANAIYCLGNPDCDTLGSVTVGSETLSILFPGDVAINEEENCVTFQTDRDHNGDGTDDDAGGFRLGTSEGVGVIEMWIGDSSADCDSTSSNWVALTDASVIDITAFSVNDDQSYDEALISDVAGNVLTTQRVRKIQMTVSASLISDDSITRTLANTIKVRNNYWF